MYNSTKGSLDVWLVRNPHPEIVDTIKMILQSTDKSITVRITTFLLI